MIQIGHIACSNCAGFAWHQKMTWDISVRYFFAGCIEMGTCVFLYSPETGITMVYLSIICTPIFIGIQMRGVLVSFFKRNTLVPNTANGVYITARLIFDKKVQSK